MARPMTAGTPTPPPSVDMEKTSDARLNLWEKLRRTRWLSREESPPRPDIPEEEQTASKPRFGRRLSRKVVPGLPRPGTFRRQNSERRHNLQPHQPSPLERRTASTSRQRALSARPASPPAPTPPQTLEPKVRARNDYLSPIRRNASRHVDQTSTSDSANPQPLPNGFLQTTSHPPSPPPPPSLEPVMTEEERAPSRGSEDDQTDDELKEELDRKWILNLSMHFRDHSPREKFFLTYAETPQKWRRLTVSCDYRDVPEDSLEHDLQQLSFQRDKSARIYESIRMSLPDIQFYDTVTNLKLETMDDRLHVHVTEDVNEIIHYPSVHTVQHIPCPRFLESELHFEAHMSGFVYKVRVREHIWIKKEIPGPDSVDEFLYEINALTELTGSTNVIELKGLVTNNGRTLVKGLLIGFAEQGALVDILYDNRGALPWSKRASWAKQIVRGLSQIHEAGFVQGDFTLSNIVIDDNDEAQIIDINRRGCPVGWEPPEVAKLIDSGQRISMYIGVKSDLFQLGMVLWGIAEEEDEPERQPRPLSLANTKEEIPTWYRELTHKCLSARPPDRSTAKELLAIFPPEVEEPVRRRKTRTLGGQLESALLERFPHLNISDLNGSRSASSNQNRHSSSRSIELPFDDEGSYMVRHHHHNHHEQEEEERGRTPPVNISHLNLNDQFHHSRPRTADRNGDSSKVEEVEEDENGGEGDGAFDPQIVPISPGGDTKWDEVEMDGTPYLVSRDKFIERQQDVDQENPRDENDAPLQQGTTDPSLAATRLENVPQQQHQPPPPAPSAILANVFDRHFQHVDSGLADMDQDLVGVGGNDSLGASPTGSQQPELDDIQLEGVNAGQEKKENEKEKQKTGESDLGLTTIEEVRVATPVPQADFQQQQKEPAGG